MICVQENVLKCKENRKMQVSNKVRKALIMHVLFPFSFTAGWRGVRKEGRAVPQATRRPALPPTTPQEIHALGCSWGLRLPRGRGRIFPAGLEAAS